MRGTDGKVSVGDRLYRNKKLFCPCYDETGVCDDCEKGSYTEAPSLSAAAGAVACKVCDKGTYQNLMGSASCKLCPPGKKLTTEGIFEDHDDLNDCDDCPIFQFSRTHHLLIILSCREFLMIPVVLRV